VAETSAEEGHPVTGEHDAGDLRGRDWRRWWRHAWLDGRAARGLLDDAACQRLQARVVSSERGHSGEIRLAVEGGLPASYLWRGASARERAITLFGKLRVWDTEHNNGVLVYVQLADRAIEVVADRALHRVCGPEDWQVLLNVVRDGLRRGDAEAGLSGAVDRLDALMRRHFPLEAGQRDVNELPDVVWRG
jgi:hypothetical protein